MAINPYTRVPQTIDLGQGFNPLDMGRVLQMGAIQQEAAEKNIEDAYALSDLIKYNAIEGTDDVALGREIQRKYEQEIQDLVASTGDKEYAKMAPKIAALKRNIQKEMSTGQIYDINQQRAKYDANIKSLDKQHELYITSGGQKGISPGKYEMYKQKALNDYIKSGAVRGGGAYVDAKPVGTMDIRGHALKLAKEYDLSTKESIETSLRSLGIDDQKLAKLTKTLESKGGAANQQAAQELVSGYIAEQLSTDPLYQGYIQEEKDLAAYQAEQGLGRPLSQMERNLIDRDVEYNLIGRSADLVAQSESGTKETLKTQVVAPRARKIGSDNSKTPEPETPYINDRPGITQAKQYFKNTDDYRQQISTLEKEAADLRAQGRDAEASAIEDKVRLQKGRMTMFQAQFIAQHPEYSDENMKRPTINLGNLNLSLSKEELETVGNIIEDTRNEVVWGGSTEPLHKKVNDKLSDIGIQLAPEQIKDINKQFSNYYQKQANAKNEFDKFVATGKGITDKVYYIDITDESALGTKAKRMNDLLNSGNFNLDDYDFIPIIGKEHINTWSDSDIEDAIQGDYGFTIWGGGTGNVKDFINDKAGMESFKFLGVTPGADDIEGAEPQMEVAFTPIGSDKRSDIIKFRVVPKKEAGSPARDLMAGMLDDMQNEGKAIQDQRLFADINVPEFDAETGYNNTIVELSDKLPSLFSEEEEGYLGRNMNDSGREGFVVNSAGTNYTNMNYLRNNVRKGRISADIPTEIIYDNFKNSKNLSYADAKRIGYAMSNVNGLPKQQAEAAINSVLSRFGITDEEYRQVMSSQYSFTTKEEALNNLKYFRENQLKGK
jgi:hypothetical protein